MDADKVKELEDKLNKLQLSLNIKKEKQKDANERYYKKNHSDIKEKARKRSNNYYTAHKNEINAKKKEHYKLNKNLAIKKVHKKKCKESCKLNVTPDVSDSDYDADTELSTTKLKNNSKNV